jgi:DNA repair photolyase
MKLDLSKHKLISTPLKHIIVDSKKKLHGWWAGKRECSSEKMLINPYNGCSVNCFFCYANNFSWGYFRHFKETNTLTVCKNYHLEVAKQLDKLKVASCGYLSPMTDPFQPIESKYHLSEKIIETFIERNLPISFTTKCIPPKNIAKLISQQEHSFGQFSILTPRKDLHEKIFSKEVCSSETLFEQIKPLTTTKNQVTGKPLHIICRIDPIIPYITSNQDDLKELIRQAEEAGAKHIIASCLDIPLNAKNSILKKLYQINPSPAYPYEKLYSEVIDGCLHANIIFREKLFSFLKEETSKRGLSLALCMEYEKCTPYKVNIGNGKKKNVNFEGLNKKFMTSDTCEAINIPVYIRKSKKQHLGYNGQLYNQFVPADCNPDYKGNCLKCTSATCTINSLAMGITRGSQKNFSYSDYQKWSKTLN